MHTTRQPTLRRTFKREKFTVLKLTNKLSASIIEKPFRLFRRCTQYEFRKQTHKELQMGMTLESVSLYEVFVIYAKPFELFESMQIRN